MPIDSYAHLVGSEQIVNCWNTSSLDALFLLVSVTVLAVTVVALVERGLL